MNKIFLQWKLLLISQIVSFLISMQLTLHRNKEESSGLGRQSYPYVQYTKIRVTSDCTNYNNTSFM